jgi:hypothetical protein
MYAQNTLYIDASVTPYLHAQNTLYVDASFYMLM